jgi:hypothetical protein
MNMTKRHKKRIGELGITKVTGHAGGNQTAEIISAPLPSNKEQLECLFATKFIEQFNTEKPLGVNCTIAAPKQNDTGDLDFRIDCSLADYLELAELNPQSEAFGREALRTGRFNIYTYARWIWLKLIKAKQRSYGAQTAGRTILLLYSTHWQFFPTDKVPECLISTLALEGCQFASIFILQTNTVDLTIIKKLWPYEGPRPRRPKDYAGFTGTNLPPGQTEWKIDGSRLLPEEPKAP